MNNLGSLNSIPNVNNMNNGVDNSGETSLNQDLFLERASSAPSPHLGGLTGLMQNSGYNGVNSGGGMITPQADFSFDSNTEYCFRPHHASQKQKS